MSSFNPEEEYEYQLYDFSCSNVLSGIKSVLDEVFESILNSMESKLTTTYKCESAAVNMAKESLRSAYKESIEKHTDDLKEVIQMYFAIPKDAVLPEDAYQKVQYTAADEEALDAQIKEAESKLLALHIMETKLSQTVNSITQYKELVEELMKNEDECESINDTLKEINESKVFKLNELNSLFDTFEELLTLKKKD